MRFTIALLSVFALFLISCTSSAVVCTEPYILVGTTCCLDKDANGICDSDEREDVVCSDAVDCSSCPPKVITQTETIEVKQYVCSDGRTVVDDPSTCNEAMRGPEITYTPVTTNEDDQVVIEEFSVRPACRGGYQAVEIYFKVGSAANDVLFQTKSSPDEEFKAAFDFGSPVFERYLYGVFCEGSCTSNADFFLKPGEKYLLRGKFDMTTTWDKIFYSNEHVIDNTEGGEYATKLC